VTHVATLLARAGRLLLALLMATVAPLVHAWEEQTGGDMPWLGRGGRAHLYTGESWPTSSHKERWGRSSWGGEEPYITVSKAMGFLNSVGVLAKAPSGQGGGSVVTESGAVVQPVALPYTFTVVMIEPTVIIMNFDLVALTRANDNAKGQVLGTPMFKGWIHYGTHVPATGTLLWFSHDVRQAPVPVSGQASGSSEIMVQGIKLLLKRSGDEWIVTRP
jgi:hypothetical protein